MGLDLSHILGAATHATTMRSKESGVKAFINTFRKYGAQVKNNFEVNFSGLPQANFFITAIDIPPVKQVMATLNYDGKAVDVPVLFDIDHDITFTVRNDAQGYIYSALRNFVMESAGKSLADSGYTMTIKALTGDEKHYKGALVTLSGVRLTTVNGLSWDYSDNGIQTFTVNAKAQQVTYTPGALQKAANVGGIVSKLLG